MPYLKIVIAACKFGAFKIKHSQVLTEYLRNSLAAVHTEEGRRADSMGSIKCDRPFTKVLPCAESVGTSNGCWQICW